MSRTRSVEYTIYAEPTHKVLDKESELFNTIPIIGETVIQDIPHYICMWVREKSEAIVIPKSHFKEDE